MNSASLVVIYVAMVAFDLSILSGTAYLVAEYQWSPAWFVLTVFLCLGSNPKPMIKAWKGQSDD